MPAFSVSQTANEAPGDWSHRTAWAFLRCFCMVLALNSGGSPVLAQVKPAAGSAGLTDEEATVAYVAEVPWQWNSEQGNPLEHWARKLAAHWAKQPMEGDERLRNLLPELSWERLAKSSRSLQAGAFVVHGYEWIENADAARLDALLVPAIDGKAAMTEFVILRQRRERKIGDARKFSMEELWKKDILVDRGDCGELVYRWLDHEIRPETGAKRREDHADYRSAADPVEAVLAVYFGEVDACVVTRSSYADVLRTNPHGLSARLEEVRVSPPLLRHVIACPRDMPVNRRVPLVKSAASVSMLQAGGTWHLIAPGPEDFKTLHQLITEWQSYYEGGHGGQSKSPPPDAEARTGPGAGQLSGRRLP